MRRAVERMLKNNKKSTFVLQLTAMVDMFTILIVFLLKSYSSSAVNVTPHENLKMPVSSSYTNPVEALKLVVAQDGVYLENIKVATVEAGRFIASEVDPNDPDFIKPLYEALDKQAEMSKEIAKVNEEHKFEGAVLMQADSRLSYSLLKKVMYTSSLAGYADLKLATILKE